jgi:hypothetical protein
MAPAEVSESVSTYSVRNLKAINRAMEFPVVSDTVGEVTKYADTIRSNGTVQSATNAMQAGFRTIADFRPVAAVTDAVLKSTATVSDALLPRMAGAVESLDSLVCHQLDHLKTVVPAIVEPTPQLLETTKAAASGYWSRALDFLSSLALAQVSLGLADKSLGVAASMVAKVGTGGSPAVEETAGDTAAATTSSSLLSRLQESIGSVRDVVQSLKKRGEPTATDLAAKVGLLMNYLRLDTILGYLGLGLQAKEVGEKGTEEETLAAATEPLVEVEAVEQTTGKRSADTDTSEDED